MAAFYSFMNLHFGNVCMQGLCMTTFLARNYIGYMGFFVAIPVAVVINFLAGANSEENDSGSMGVFDVGEG